MLSEMTCAYCHSHSVLLRRYPISAPHLPANSVAYICRHCIARIEQENREAA